MVLFATKFLFIAIAIFIHGCNPYPETVRDAMVKSGDNRVELEMAIEHYKAHDDSLKLEALYFLISQLPNYGTLNYRLVDSYGSDVTPEKWKYKSLSEAESDLGMIGLHFELNSVTEDIKTITKDYLISNIDLSFEVWRNYPWCKALTFDEFCRQILPHKINGDPMNDWRLYFYKKHKIELDSFKALNARIEDVVFWLNDRYKKEWVASASSIPSHYLTYQEIEKMGGGTCDHLAKNAVQLMRACGISLNLDLVPFHGRINGGHVYNSLYSSNKKFIYFSPYDRDPERSKWRAPRVFRQVFESQPYPAIKFIDYHDLPPGVLRNPFLEDVTSQYFPTSDVTINVSKKEGNVFLCTYNGGIFRALIWEVAKMGKVCFENVTKELLYFPMYYNQGALTPAGNAFILREDGHLLEFEDEKKEVVQQLTVRVFEVNKNITRPDELYSLYNWNGSKWEYMTNSTANENQTIDFNNIEGSGLYLIRSVNGLKQIERPFTYFNDKVEYW